MTVYRSEDTMIFCALTPNITKIDAIYKGLKRFFIKKSTIDPSDRFNLIAFLKNGPNYLENFTLNYEHIIITLQSLEPKLADVDIGRGILVAFASFLNVFKKIPEKYYRLIILTDEGSIKISEQYFRVLKNFFEKVKKISFIIDVVKFNDTDTSEDSKLSQIINLCNGKVYKLEEFSEFPSVMEKLAEKQDYPPPLSSNGIVVEVLEYDNPFYEDLADKPIDYKQEGTCSICFQKDTQGIVQCPNCETLAHKICMAHWARTSHIGIPHLFRCHNCFNIIKLNKQFVKNIQLEKPLVMEEIKIKSRDLQKYLESLETPDGPKVISIEDMINEPEDADK